MSFLAADGCAARLPPLASKPSGYHGAALVHPARRRGLSWAAGRWPPTCGPEGVCLDMRRFVAGVWRSGRRAASGQAHGSSDVAHGWQKEAHQRWDEDDEPAQPKEWPERHGGGERSGDENADSVGPLRQSETHAPDPPA